MLERLLFRSGLIRLEWLAVVVSHSEKSECFKDSLEWQNNYLIFLYSRNLEEPFQKWKPHFRSVLKSTAAHQELERRPHKVLSILSDIYLYLEKASAFSFYLTMWRKIIIIFFSPTNCRSSKFLSCVFFLLFFVSLSNLLFHTWEEGCKSTDGGWRKYLLI